jgi:hypothetical protein
MAKVNDLLQQGTKKIILTIVRPPDSESCRRKESRTPPIGNPKTQENQHPHPALLQNRILDQLKSQRQINRFRILHRRLERLNLSLIGAFIDLPAA